eukprot:gene5926-6612_t
MGKNSSRVFASLLIISYVMLSIYWINKYLNSEVNTKYRRHSNSSNFEEDVSYDFNGKHSTRNKAEKIEIDHVLAMSKLRRYLEAEWHGKSSTKDVSNSSGEFKRMWFDSGSNSNNMIDVSRVAKTNTNPTSHSNTASPSSTCKSLASGNDMHRESTLQLIEKMHAKSERKYRSDAVMLGLFSRCKEMREFLQHPALHSSSDKNTINTSDIRIAYSILLTRPADQTLQLLRAIYDPSNAYCLHVDISASKRYLSIMQQLTVCFDNVFLAPTRYDIAFPSSKRIEAHLSCFRKLLALGISWRYVLSISGSIYPLRNNSIIKDYLKHRTYSNQIYSLDSDSVKFLRRTKFVHVFNELQGRRHFVRTKKLKPPPPGNMRLFRGESTFLATREFAEYLTTSKMARELLEWSHDTRYPDEFYWATLHRLPGVPGGMPYRNDVEMPDQTITNRLEDISSTQENVLVIRLARSMNSYKCEGQYRNNICIFSHKDLRWLLGQDNLFAGPFDMGVDRIVLECLYQNLRNPLVEDHDF